MNTPEKIYLIDEGDECYWCEDPAPGIGMDEKDAVKYIRADIHIAEQAKNLQLCRQIVELENRLKQFNIIEQ